MRKWRRYENGPYRLGALHGEAVATWKEEGKRHRYRLGVHTEIEGRSALDRFARQRAVLELRSAATVETLWAAYLADRTLDGKNVENMRQHWKALRPRFGGLSPSDVDTDLCRRYAGERLATVSQGTVWTELTQLRSCLNWAFKRNVLAVKPYVWVPSKPAPKDRVLTESEAIRLLDACKTPHLKLFVILALATAARSAALLQLTWERVDFAAGTIDLRLGEAVNPLQKVVHKGRAMVPMNDWARESLQEAKAGALTDHVIEWDGAPVACIRNAYSKAVARSGLSGVTPHTLRHTAASWALWSGSGMLAISRYLGHRSEKTTAAIYAKSNTEHLRPVATVLQLRKKA